MHLVVLGASGGVGRELVRQAHAAGHVVVAVGRASSDLDVPEGVTVQRGEQDDPAFLAACFDGADAVLSGLGPRVGGLAPWHKPKDPAFLERSTAALVEAAGRAGVSRVVVVSAGGAGDSWDAMPSFFKVFIRVTSLGNAYPLLSRMEEILLASDLDVCIARPSGLTDEPATDEVRVVTGYVGQASIPRADVAGWMLQQAAAASIEHRKPLITVTGGA
jgi:uncharacterized protein YbjT (DUF2867 family)